MKKPKTLQQAIIHFADPGNCLKFMVKMRWSDGVVTCPTCGRKDVVFLENQRKWQCKSVHAKRQFSAKVGTIFEDSALPLDKWLIAMWMVANCKNGVSSYEVHRALGITQKSAWFMLHRIRVALKQPHSSFKLGGPESGGVEIDETFVGGKVRNMHRARRVKFAAEGGHTGGATGKAVVVGMLDRDLRQVRASVIPNVKRETLQAEILNNVKYGSPVYTDDAVPYNELRARYVHEVVNHSEVYVKGRVHTNGLENFWALLKRGLKGTYVAVEPFHLESYVDEQIFRYNNRATKDNPLNDADRFALAMSQVVGKRLTYDELTGKNAERPL
jgi:transposase-like protein